MKNTNTITNSHKTLVSGIKPTGRPHIGNYLGAIRQFIEYADQYNSFVFIAEYHALTSLKDPKTLSKYTYDLAVDYLALGLDPKKTALYRQSDVPQVTELTWIFNCLTTVPYLERAHAYKDAVSKGKKPNVGLFDYPLLMASDILIMDADVVPVGQDQKQHIEITRDTAEAFNREFGEAFTLPKAIIPESSAVIPGIDGQKMSKSYNNHIPLFCSEEELERKVMSIQTDSKGVDEPKNPKDDTVYQLHTFFATEDELEALEERYRAGNIGYKESKELLLKNISEFITPLREKREKIANDREYVLGVLEEGGKHAKGQAEKKMQKIRDKVGIHFDK